MNEKNLNTGGVNRKYPKYKRQKCFLAYSEDAKWSDDLLSACQQVISQAEFNLEIDYSRRHFNSDIPLRQKALELIANARYGIYDLSYWQNESGKWILPSNVFIELGMAIALNRPILMLRNSNNQDIELPKSLSGMRQNILEFSGESTLKKTLEEHVPGWVDSPPERDWWNRNCIFGGRQCDYREAHPRLKRWGQHTLECLISDGQDIDRPDFRNLVEEVLGRYSSVTFKYLDALRLVEGFEFLLCSNCQIIRSTPFAIFRITPNTPPETFIAIGMSIALEHQFENKIPKILLAENLKHIPSLLIGYEVVIAQNNREMVRSLRELLPTVIEKVRNTNWVRKPLPFIEVKENELFVSLETEQRGISKLLIVEDDQTLYEMLEYNLARQSYEVIRAMDGETALDLAKQEQPDLIILDIMLPGKDGFEVCRLLRAEGNNAYILMLTARAEEVDKIVGLEVGADDYLTKPFSMRELIARVKVLLRQK